MAKEKAQGPIVDNERPDTITLQIVGPNNEVWGSISAPKKDFSTGSKGFYASGKVRNPKNGLPYQVGCNIILVGSKG